MALICCPECCKDVSDKATLCPNCGYGIKRYLKQEGRNNKKKIRESIVKEDAIKNARQKGIAVILMLILVVVFVVYLIYKKNIMPNVIGLEVSEAISILEEQNINYITKMDYSYDYEKDYVFKQSYSENQYISDDDCVEISISAGKKYIVPELIGKTFEEIKPMLEGMQRKVLSEKSYEYEEGTILYASKDAGEEILENETLVIKVSSGLYKYVPNIKGLSKEEAEEVLGQVGLLIDFRENVTQANVDIGDVYKYEPLEYIEEGEVIVAYVSTGEGICLNNYINTHLNDDFYNSIEKIDVTYSIEESYGNMTTDCIADSDDSIIIKQSRTGIVPVGSDVKFTISKPAIEITNVKWDINYVGGVDTYVYFKNISNKEIAYVNFEMQYFDRMGNVAQCEISDTSIVNLLYTGPLSAGASAKNNYWDAVVYNSTVDAIRPNSATIEFTDGTAQKLTYDGRYWYGSEYYGGDLKD